VRIGIGRHAPDSDTVDRLAASRAVADALRGAAGLSDTEEERAAGAEESDPRDALSRAVRDVEGKNYQVVNVDLTVIGDEAGAGSGEETAGRRMREALAGKLHVAPEKVSLKPGGGPAGDGGRGRAVLAVVLLDRIDPMDQVHSALRAGG